MCAARCPLKRALATPLANPSPHNRLYSPSSTWLQLGLDEGVAQLTLRTWLVILTHSGEAEKRGEETVGLAHWAFFTFLPIWIIASLATVPYMRVVFRRYETTMALPIEYGTVFVANSCSGLLFFDETSNMEAWQVAVVLLSVVIVLGGMDVAKAHEARSATIESAATIPRCRCAPANVALSTQRLLRIKRLPAIDRGAENAVDACQLRGHLLLRQ